MDYKKISQDVVDHVGGISNIKGATHCVTRLRLILLQKSFSYLYYIRRNLSSTRFGRKTPRLSPSPPPHFTVM